MGHQRSYSWECKLQMVQLLEKGEQNPSQISRDHHVTRSLLYVWWQLYRERGEAAFVPTQAFPASTRGGSTAPCARPDCPSRATVWATGPRTRFAAIRGRCVKKSLASAPIRTVTRAHRARAGADALLFGAQALSPVADQPTVVLPASLSISSPGIRSTVACCHPGSS
jgi:transposase-like protein